MLNKTICCLSVLIYFICSTRHHKTYKKCSRRKIFWTKYFKFTAAFSDSHHHSSRIYSVRVFILFEETKLTKPRVSEMLDINLSIQSLSDVKIYTRNKSQVSLFFFFTFYIIEIEDQSLIGSNWQQQDLLKVKIGQSLTSNLSHMDQAHPLLHKDS